MILNQEQLSNILDDVTADILNQYKAEVLKIILFGSYAKGIAKERPDIDILILFRNKMGTISDKQFATEIRDKYLDREYHKEVHLLCENKELYDMGCEDYYKDIESYCKTIYQTV